jgi:hypothetical protein
MPSTNDRCAGAAPRQKGTHLPDPSAHFQILLQLCRMPGVPDGRAPPLVGVCAGCMPWTRGVALTARSTPKTPTCPSSREQSSSTTSACGKQRAGSPPLFLSHSCVLCWAFSWPVPCACQKEHARRGSRAPHRGRCARKDRHRRLQQPGFLWCRRSCGCGRVSRRRSFPSSYQRLLEGTACIVPRSI